MNLLDLVERDQTPAPWAEGDNIPWNDPDFSRRMLAEHLTQSHDHASRRTALIEQHVNWIFSHVLGGKAGKVLDLGCGPGLYAARFAQRGCEVRGIDYSPASIRYAREQALHAGLPVEYVEADVRAADYGTGHDLAMMIFGEFNVFRPSDARLILNQTHAALKPGGRLLLEVSTYQSVRRIAEQPPSWFSSRRGLFSDGPYLLLEENFWDEGQQTATTRMFRIDAANGEVVRYAQTFQAYHEDALAALLASCGFTIEETFPGMGEGPAESSDFQAVVARSR